VVEYQNYLNPQTLANVEGLGLQARLIVEGYVAGMHKSPYHGFSVEFSQHREYAPGDDVRHIDWKVWSKTDKYYLKQYEEETNLLTYLLLDASASMGYASGGNVSKLKYGQYIAAALSYLVLSQQDSVGLAVFDDKIRRFLKPSGQPSHLKELIRVMDSEPAQERTGLGPVLHEMAERIGRRGIVVLISDLLDGESADLIAGLKHFRHRGHEVVLFHVLDPAEVEFPFRQVTKFKGIEIPEELLTDPTALRDGYLAEMAAFTDSVRTGCRLADIDYVPLRTDQSLDSALTGYLATRSARTRKGPRRA
jgi:uncharacterized protein (DUF58 family)